MNGYQNINELEKSVAHAGTQLFTVAHKLHQVERSLDSTSLDDMDDICVMELLESMTEVKNEYQNLRKDIQEVQQLQRDCHTSIRYQMHSMQHTFQMLKKRIEMKANNKTATAVAAAAANASSVVAINTNCCNSSSSAVVYNGSSSYTQH